MPDVWDVAVVGGGPSGAVTAALLARSGHRVVLLDRAHFPRHKACAEYMSPGVPELLKDLDLFRSLPAPGLRSVPGMDVRAPNGAYLRLRYDGDGTPDSAWTMRRWIFDAALLARAAHERVEIREGSLVRRPIMADGRVSGVYARSNGREEQVRARLTIVADGSRSTLAHSLGLSRSPKWPRRIGLITYFEGEASLRDGFGQMHVSAGGYCGVAPVEPGVLNIGLVVPFDAVKRSGLNATRFLETWIQSRAGLRQTLSACRRAAPVRGVSPVGARASTPWVPGALLVGDAAGFFDPFTGEGIFRAILGARLAAQVARGALATGNVGASALAPYADLRRGAFRSKSLVTAIIQLFVQYPALLEYAVPRLTGRPEASRTLASVLGDLCDANAFLSPRMLWSALRP